MKKLSDLTKKQKLLMVAIILAIIIIAVTLIFILKKEEKVDEKGKTNNIDEVEIKIEDRCDITLQTLETFYSDAEYDYQFSSVKSSCTYVIVDKKEYLVKEALENKVITISEAEKAGLKFYKEPKATENKLKIEDRCEVTAQAIETFYSDDLYDYQFSSIKSGCTYAILGNKEYPITEALESKIITIEEAQLAGLEFTKVEKNQTNNKTIKIEDRCEVTAQAIETFYSDSKYNYQFSSIKSGCTYAIVNDRIYPIKDALNKGIITISEAEKAGLKFTKVAKQTTSTKTIKIEDKCGNNSTLTVMETFYSDSKYDYQFSSPKSSCTYAIVNNKRYLIKDALNNKVITISEAEKAGLKFFKTAKTTTTTKTVKIEDKCEVTAQAIETFYSDSNYNYQFSSIKSGCTYAIVNNKRYLIKDALNNKIITISEAEKAGLQFYKEPKLKIEDRCKSTGNELQVTETFYRDSKYEYQFPTPRSSCTFAILGGKEYPIKDALSKGIITIYEAEKAGLKFIREENIYEIRNVCDIYVNEVEPFYSDENYTYSFSGALSNCLYVKKNGNDARVVDAVREGLITIEDVINAGITVIKTRK